MLLDALARLPGLASSYEIRKFDHSQRSYALVAVVTFADDSRLFIKDLLFESGARKYAYHWQRADGSLQRRWDNKPHWPEVNTFPHHQHLPDGTVGPSYVRSLDEAIEQIARAQGFMLDS